MSRDTRCFVVTIVVIVAVVVLCAICARASGTEGELRGEVVNGVQVYLSWDGTVYSSHWAVARSTHKGGYYTIIADHLKDLRFADTPPPSEYPYYYVAIRSDDDTGNEETRTKELRVNLQ